jgi:hypothetical protein
MKKLEQQYAPFQVISLISRFGTKEVSSVKISDTVQDTCNTKDQLYVFIRA